MTLIPHFYIIKTLRGESTMIRQNMFEKKYSLLAPYILDESVRKNMLSNEDLLRKYDSNHSMIKAYINEIDKRFDRETINKMIIEVECFLGH